MKNPLTERRKLLFDILPQSDVLKFSQCFQEGISLYNKLKEMGMEGIIAKKKTVFTFPVSECRTG